MVTTLTKHLPPFIQFEGCTFQLVFTIEHDKTGSLAYVLTDVSIESKHIDLWNKSRKWVNVQYNKPMKVFVRENHIANDMELRLAVHTFKKILTQYNIRLK